MAALTLKSIPTDVMNAVKKEQREIKKKKGLRVYSLDLTIYSMIRSLMKMRENCKEEPE